MNKNKKRYTMNKKDWVHYVDAEEQIEKAKEYLEDNGWHENTDSLMLKSYPFQGIANWFEAAIDLKNREVYLDMLSSYQDNNIFSHVSDLKDKDDINSVIVAFNKTKRDFEYVMKLLKNVNTFAYFNKNSDDL